MVKRKKQLSNQLSSPPQQQACLTEPRNFTSFLIYLQTAAASFHFGSTQDLKLLDGFQV